MIDQNANLQQNAKTAELLEELMDEEPPYALSLAGEIVNRSDAVQLIKDILGNDAYWNDLEGKWLHIHALFLLGIMGSNEAFECISAIILPHADELDDYLTEDLSSVFASFGSSFFDKVAAIVLDIVQDPYVRAAAYEALDVMAFREHKFVPKLIEITNGIYDQKQEDDFQLFISPIAAQLNDAGVYEKVKASRGEDGADDFIFGTMADLDAIHNGAYEHQRARVLANLNLWRHFTEMKAKTNKQANGQADAQTIHAPRRKHVDRKRVGRNDPCPCGSGLKYKKCHGKVK